MDKETQPKTIYCNNIIQLDKAMKQLQQQENDTGNIVIVRYSPLNDLLENKPDESLDIKTIEEFKKVLHKRRQLATKLLGE